MQAAQESQCAVEIVRGPLSTAALKSIQRMRSKVNASKKRKIGFEDTKVSAALAKRLAESVQLVPLGNTVEQPRLVKSAPELELIHASVQLNSQALDNALRHFRVGMTEQELAAEIDYQQRLLGAESTAFDTIVASGPHSALPHAHPRKAPILAGQYLLIDMGAKYNGYMSDMTRTFGVGRMPRKAKKMYDAVLEAQLAAIDAVRPGATAGQVHRAAVKVLARHGLDKLFIHSTGHGLGLEIHEAPRLGNGDDTKLLPGMAITIEPGVYEPGFGGVRIEDTVVVRDQGVENFTPSAKQWTIVG